MRRKPSVWRLRFSISANGSRRSPWFHPAAAPSKSAPMAKRSTPNSTPANGRISTRSLGRLRRRALKENQSGSQEPRKRARHDSPNLAFLFWFSGFQIQFSRRVKGAWWPSRSSKSPSVFTGRGRFDSYPLRLFSAEDQSGKQESRKEQRSAVAAQPPLFFLHSCIPDSISSPIERR